MQVGDVVVSFAGQPVTGIDSLHKLLTDSRIGTQSPMTAIRHTEKMELEVVPAESK
ncbi:MAG TPA: hypothetical protein VG754_09870 [Verrucomicrobiae bacterium]|nr:hypothetical protein [Verrucomicrobiae bacterium]